MTRALALVALSGLFAGSSALSAVAHPHRLSRPPTKVRSVSCRLGDVTGECSRKIDFKRGKVCETTPSGRRVCRDFSTHALGRFDDLDVELADVEDLPSWWILAAEADFRLQQARDGEASF